jgi:6-phosphofructokinase 2
MVVDTPGDALRLVLEQAGIELVKPSRSEFESLIGRPLRGNAELEQAAVELVRSGGIACVAVPLGGDGAVLATADGALRLPPLDVPVRGATGAGDSFLAAMTLALSRGAAAGAAAVSNAGTAHPSKAEVEALLRRVRDIPMDILLGEGH